ncbi:MAG TPA: TetR/AcrR family transcriptional regulator [Gemmatimonadales bacterium]
MRPYHHGDLRTTLIRCGLALLRAEGPEALTLRGVAREAGVSQTAPYRHFTDRRALAAAIAAEGFRGLGAAMGRAMQRHDGHEAFRQVAFAYIRYAHQHAAEYRIMFGSELAHRADLPELAAASRSVLELVTAGIERLQAAGLVGAGDARALATSTWAMLHGLVMLSLDAQTGGSGHPPEQLDPLIETAIHLLLFGMAPEPRRSPRG